MVIGTNKKGSRGLLVYDLSGREVQGIVAEAMNNVDLRVGSSQPTGAPSTIVAATTVDGRSLKLFQLNAGTRRLDEVPIATFDTGIRSAGVCLYQSARDGTFGFVTGGDGSVQQWHLTDAAGDVVGNMVRELALDSRTEGCVVDDVSHQLYVAEEATGIWRFDARPGSSSEGQLVEPASSGRLTPDVEGLAIARLDQGTYLLASSQGDDRFVAFRSAGGQLQFVGDFTVVESGSTDAVTHTDGLEVSTATFGTGPFADGLLVVQDDRNETDGKRDNQNFKFVSWGDVEHALGID